MTNIPAVSASATWTIPLQVTIHVGTPIVMHVPVATPMVATALHEGTFGTTASVIVPDDRFAIATLLGTSFGYPGALSLGLASRLAYRTEADVMQIAASGWGLEVRSFSVDETQCFAARAGSTAFIAFRGTESLGDWLGNLNMISTTRPYGAVHRGFLGAFQVVAPLLEDLLTAWNASAVWLTGHSLGGALATVAAAEWYGRFPIAGVATYGQPAVGKGSFGDFMQRNYRDRFFRYVNDSDLVPRVPPTYRHVGQRIPLRSLGEPSFSRESLEGQSEVVPDIEPPQMTEAEFDRLRAELLQQQAELKTAGLGSYMEIRTEGWIPGLRDHSLERYLERIVNCLPPA